MPTPAFAFSSLLDSPVALGTRPYLIPGKELPSFREVRADRAVGGVCSAPQVLKGGSEKVLTALGCRPSITAGDHLLRIQPGSRTEIFTN